MRTDPSAADVLRVLAAHGVQVDRMDDGRVKLKKADRVERKRFLDHVPRRIVLGLGFKFGIPQEHFWHPEKAPGGTCDPDRPAN